MEKSNIIPFGAVKIILIFYTMCYILPILYVFCTIYFYVPDPLIISKAQFDVISKEKVVPEGIRANVNERTGTIDPNNIKKDDIENLHSISYCQKGECVVDRKTGIKRCAGNDLDALLYNTTLEVCSAKFSCTNSELFYSVLPDNSTSENGFCQTIQGEEVACNCSKYKKCPGIISSYYKLENGLYDTVKLNNPYISNYTINPSKFASEYCKLNIGLLSFTSIPCDLKLKEGLPMDCLSNDTVTQKSNNGLQEQSLNNNSKIIEYDAVSSSLIANIFKPEILTSTGYFIIENEKYYYGGINLYYSIGEDLETGQTIISSEFKNIYKISGEPIENLENKYMNIYTDWTEFKNMCNATSVGGNPWQTIGCFQEASQGCIKGYRTYMSESKTVDTFCKYNISGGDIIENSYLTDPMSGTVSCIPGKGCGYFIDVNLCLTKIKTDTTESIGNIVYNCKDSYIQKLKTFAGEIDYSGIHNVFMAEKATSDEFDGIYSKSTDPIFDITGDNASQQYTIKIYNSYLLDLDKGDYFYMTSEFYGLAGSPIFDKASGITEFKARYLPGGINNFTSTGNELKIYKQFGFNGINYDTVGIIKPDTGNKYKYTRKYTESSRWGFIKEITGIVPVYFMGTVDEQTEPLYPPYSMIDIDDSKEYILESFRGKTDYNTRQSMYYPLYDKVSYSQVCTMCNPYLVAFGKNYNEGNNNYLENVHIQFCSQDFGNYIPVPSLIEDKILPSDVTYSPNFYIDYKLSFFIKTSKMLISNTDIIKFDDPNNNIEVGDLIVDGDGLLDKLFIYTPQEVGDYLPNFIGDINLLVSGDLSYFTPEDCYVPFTNVNGEELIPQNATLKPNGKNVFTVGTSKNYFAGKKYFPVTPTKPENNSVQGEKPLVYFMIKPSTTVVYVSDDKKTIYTSSNSRIKLSKDSDIQIIKKNDNLVIESGMEDYEEDLYVTGITKKRITSLTVKKYLPLPATSEVITWRVKIKQYKKLL